MKSFNLKAETRKDIARTLTTEAIKDAALITGADLKQLNDDVWSDYIKQIEDITKVPREFWAELMSEGIMTCTTSIMPEHEWKMDGRIHRDAVKLHQSKTQGWDYFAEAIHPQKLPTLFAYTAHRNRNYPYYCLRLSVDSAVPQLQSANTWFKHNPYLERARIIAGEFNRLAEAAIAFHSSVTDILQSCRTSRQLEDLFPEAAKLLPHPVKQDNQLAPIEVVQQVRDALKTGVPPRSAK